MNPMSPSKIGDGPVKPCLASEADTMQLRAAFGAEQAFQLERVPERACRMATWLFMAMLIASDSRISRPAAITDDNNNT